MALPNDGTDLGRFLNELGQLSLKYGIYVEGCGCCNSPTLRWVNTFSEQDETHLDLYWDVDENQYTTDEHTCVVCRGHS